MVRALTKILFDERGEGRYFTVNGNWSKPSTWLDTKAVDKYMFSFGLRGKRSIDIFVVALYKKTIAIYSDRFQTVCRLYSRLW